MYLSFLESVQDKVLWLKIKSQFVSDIKEHDWTNLRFVKQNGVVKSWHDDHLSRQYFLSLLVNAAASVIHDNDWYAKHKLPKLIVDHSYGRHLTCQKATVSYSNKVLKQYINQNMILKKDIPDYSASKKPSHCAELKKITDLIIDKHYKQKRLDNECFAMIYKEYSQYITAYIKQHVTCVSVTYERTRYYYLMEQALADFPDVQLVNSRAKHKNKTKSQKS